MEAFWDLQSHALRSIHIETIGVGVDIDHEPESRQKDTTPEASAV